MRGIEWINSSAVYDRQQHRVCRHRILNVNAVQSKRYLIQQPKLATTGFYIYTVVL
jgi:hypothetical protein